MKTATTALLLALATMACSPREGSSTAQVQPTVQSIAGAVHPQVGEGAADGQVYEYY
jgi:hypothetical protein